MRTIARCALIATIAAAAACGEPQVNRDEEERPAPPDRLTVTTKAGARFSGTAARIDIRYLDPSKPPHVEVAFSASGVGGRTWAMQATARPDFLRTLALSAEVVDRPLEPGYATVQVASPESEASLAPSGLVVLHADDGRVSGSVTSTDERFAASFEGPFVVTCAVPSRSIVRQSGSERTDAALIVDEAFTSGLCRQHAALAGRRP